MKALMEMKSKLGLIAILALTVFTLGCDSGSGSGGGKGAVGGGNGNPPVTDPDPNVTPTGGITVDLINVDPTVLAAYSAKPEIAYQNPQEIKLKLNLQKFGTYTKTGGGFDYGYGGYVSVSFKTSVNNPYTNQTTTQQYQDTFDSLVDSSGVINSNASNHRYNLLSSDYPELGGQLGYHGFFEDRYGAVILVIDTTNDLGDGQGPTSANGSIWYKNHGLSYAPLSPTSCWFVSVGPYDCRTWKTGDNVATKRSIYPDSGYVKLGEFINLNMKSAFNL